MWTTWATTSTAPSTDQLEARALGGVGPPRCATIAPDGRRIAFGSEGELRTIGVTDGR